MQLLQGLRQPPHMTTVTPHVLRLLLLTIPLNRTINNQPQPHSSMRPAIIKTYREHLEGQRHKKKELLQKEGAAPPTSARGAHNLRCELCDVVCTGSDAYAAHLRGSKHMKVVKLHKILGKPIPEVELKTAKAPAAPAGAAVSVTSPPKINFVQSGNLGTVGKTAADAKETIKEEVADVEMAPENEVTPVGQEYIEELRSDDGKLLSFNCKLCECKFNDPNAKDMHMKGRRHRLQFKKKVNPDLVVDVKPSGRRGRIQEEKMRRRDDFLRRREDDRSTTDKPGWIITGIVRVGILAKNLMLTDENNVELVALCNEIPTKQSLAQAYNSFASQLKARPANNHSSVIVIRIIRDLCHRNPTWAPLSQWALELLVDKVVGCVGFSVAEALRKVLEAIAGGVLLPGSAGIFDPCEREPTDASANMTIQERTDITASAQVNQLVVVLSPEKTNYYDFDDLINRLFVQHALRLMAFRQIHKVLGMAPIPPPRGALNRHNNQRFNRKRRRDNSTGENNDSEGQDLHRTLWFLFLLCKSLKFLKPSVLT
ncbi:unnamed protein product [Nesidiocoris tenuis]|uniref:DZF domain-containing protein n=1 Tax=Nesidiocoris tenuis TaxID=355587 RepID=A0A6H5GW32_9HEMI|nr:unnamed protein product [Nesidiocoris tenuis]